ncbi:hypothetical protein UA08_02959 [Talaromyces atroroseus]|uniref:Uncharacterized protein n=1 Tax=Talaromyces atroroseus TaxID=1441469 RepID=A0A225B5C7_TALAT|nr:hypothetical protein UA08_02959 [Talaromyces atroroseus]OKL62075.1 hypothetical protein UA08_02959 [Talaromyces atroroseus]
MAGDSKYQKRKRRKNWECSQVEQEGSRGNAQTSEFSCQPNWGRLKEAGGPGGSSQRWTDTSTRVSAGIGYTSYILSRDSVERMDDPPITTVSSDSRERSSRPMTQTTKRPQITPREYAEAIISHSKQTIQDTLYPGNVFEDLGLYLKNGLQNYELPGNNIQGTFAHPR